ncbi:hypothetical protein [Nonomuraea sp. bgisy101]|uniref:hypothetical protein n=1 Tax=Nonomuraea sp. bgisy101 TaxID=3413784 RepID=UPI003D75A4F6
MNEQQTFAATPVWARLFHALDQLDDHGMGALHGMAKHWRATLPGEVVALVDTLDAIRDLAVALTADRKGMTVEEIEAVIAGALAEGGHNG